MLHIIDNAPLLSMYMCADVYSILNLVQLLKVGGGGGVGQVKWLASQDRTLVGQEANYVVSTLLFSLHW